MNYKFKAGDQFWYKQGNYFIIIKDQMHRDNESQMNIYQVTIKGFDKIYLTLHSEGFLEKECVLLTKEAKLELL